MSEFSIVSADGTELFGRHWPTAKPKAVMALVHGYGEHCGRYQHMAAHLNSKHISVVTADLRGHGKSSGKRGVILNYDEFHQDLAALLRQTRSFYPDVPLILYGHSMGGELVIDHGIRGLDDMPIISSAPFLTPAEPVPAALRFIVKIMTKILPRGTITQPIDGTKISSLAAEQSLYLNDLLNHGIMGFRLVAAMVEIGEGLMEKAQTWNRPLLLMHSKADQLTDFESSAAFAKVAKQVEFHAFETPEHEMHNDTSRDEVYALMTDFILRQAKGASA